MSGHISLGQFAQTAQRAAQVGGSLDITRNNELVVRGSTWVGRQVQWLRQHLFPGKVRQKNQKVLNALNKTLRNEVGLSDHSVSGDILGDAKKFTREIANTTSLHQNQRQRDMSALAARRQGYSYFENPKNVKSFPRGEQTLIRHVSKNLDKAGKEAVKTRYLDLLESIGSDRKFMLEGKIPGGGGEVYRDSHGNINARVLRAAYMVAAEESYERENGSKVTVPGARGEELYGLRDESEVDWVRQKLEQLG